MRWRRRGARPSRSASCTPGATPRMSGGGRRGAARLPRRLRHRPRTCCRRSRNSNASPRRSPTPRSGRSRIYLARLAERLSEGGLSRPPLIILSHGGVATVEEATRSPPAPRCPARPAASPRRRRWRSGRGRGPGRLRHGRHQHRHRAGARRRPALAAGRERGRGADRPAEPGHRHAWARAAAPRRYRPVRPAPVGPDSAGAVPARPATAGAAPRRP